MRLKRAHIWPFALALSIFAASSVSTLATPGIDLNFSKDKLAHFLVFGLVATTLIRNPWFLRKGWRGVLLVICLTSAFGAADELRQAFTPGRSVEFADWIADTAGALLASVLYYRWKWYRSLLERPCFGKSNTEPRAPTPESRRDSPDASARRSR